MGSRREASPAAGRGIRPSGAAFPLWLAAPLVGLLVLVSHLPLRFADYVQDDHLAVEGNLIVERGRLAEIYSSSYWEGASGDDRTLYRPTAILSYAWERRLTGEPNPFVAHTVNVALHMATTILLIVLARRLGASGLGATACGLFFSAHPAHVEAVANIVGRAEILAAGFSFLALLLLSFTGDWGSTRGPSTGLRRAASWASAACVFLALGAKEVALATPLLMLAMEWLFRPAADGRGRAWYIDRATALAPTGLALLVYLTLRTRALEMLASLQPAHPMDNLLVDLHGVERLATGLGLVVRYAGLLLFPVSLSADYSGPVIAAETSLAAPRPLAGLAILAACAALAAIPLIRRARDTTPESSGGGATVASFAALLFLLPYLIISNLPFRIGTVLGERLIYLPSAGFCLFLGFMIGRFTGDLAARPAEQRRRLALAIVGVLVAAYGTRTWARCLDWRDDETLFTAAIQARPLSPRAHFIVGKIEGGRGELDSAHRRLDRTLELFPAHSAALFEKGVLYAQSNRFDDAEAMFRRTLSISPSFADAQYNHGAALRRLRRVDEAERALRKAVLWNPELSRAWAELGNLHLDAREWAWAAEAYRRAIALGRNDLRSRLRLAERGSPRVALPARPD